MEKSLALEKNNSYGYMNLGIYYLDTGACDKALKNFQIAWDLDQDTYLLKEYMDKVKQKMETDSNNLSIFIYLHLFGGDIGSVSI